MNPRSLIGRRGGVLVAFAVMAVILGVQAPAAMAQGGVSTVTFEFVTEDGAEAGNGVMVQGVAVSTAAPTAIPIESATDIQITAPQGAAVLRVDCVGAERSRAIISGSGTRLTVVPSGQGIDCVVTMLTGLPVTGSRSNAIAAIGLGLVAAGAAAAGAARRSD